MIKTTLLLTLLVSTLLITAQTPAPSMKYHLSTHVLDISCGKPAPNVSVQLEKQDSSTQQWQIIATKKTDANGRIPDFLPVSDDNTTNYKGIYRLTFHTKEYYEARKESSFYPFIQVVFELNDSNHYHVPITVSPFGYSTYRGS